MGMSGGSGLVVSRVEVIAGLSSDSKPTLSAGVRALFVETDTGSVFYWDGSAWVPLNRKEYRQVTDATASLTADETIVGVNRGSGVTLTLPSAQAVLAGRPYVVKDESGAAATNNITVDTEGSETIDGAATDTLSTNYGSIGYYSNGTNWFKI